MVEDGFTVMSDGTGTPITAGDGPRFTMGVGTALASMGGIGFRDIAGALLGFTGDLPTGTLDGPRFLQVVIMLLA